MKKLLLAAASTALIAAALPASADVLTFEGHSNTIFNAPITLGDYTVGNVAGDEQHFHLLDGGSFPGEYVPDGTGILANDRDTRLFIELTGGGLFSLGSFDAAGTRDQANTSGANTLRVSGYVANVLTGTFDFAINNNNYTNLAGLSGSYDRIVFDGIDGPGGFTLDNVNLTAGVVPEPATWAMMIMGFGLAGAGMRRRRAITA